MPSRTRLSLFGWLLACVAGVAAAQNAVTARPASVHAGPDQSYPLVAHLDPGAPVLVNGCLDDWSWCDVSFGDDRGWVYAPVLSYDYQGGVVPLYDYAPSLGIPVVVFSVGPYWDHYYRSRPWYSQRATWVNRRPPEHMRPPQPPHRGPPPAPVHTAHNGGATPHEQPHEDGHPGHHPATPPPHEAAPEHAPAPSAAHGPAAHGPNEAHEGAGHGANVPRSEPHGSAEPHGTAEPHGNAGHEEPRHQETQHPQDHGDEHPQEGPH